MSQIYKRASKVMIWLGPEDEDSRLCKQWLREIDIMIRKMEHAHKMIRGSPTYVPEIRRLTVKSTFINPDNDAMYPPAIRRFWQKPWFTRGWIVQEYLLAKTEAFLTGDLQFSTDDLEDLHNIPSAVRGSTDAGDMSYTVLMNVKLNPFSDPQPLRFLRLVYQITQEFKTFLLVDSLFAVLGLIEEAGFKPDYTASIKDNFTRFAVTLAQRFGSLDFLSLWSANLDPIVPTTPKEILATPFPSWVPSWTWVPLSAPFRYAVGAVRSLGEPIAYNAAGGRKHVHDQTEDAAATDRLFVRGMIVDSVQSISSARFHKYWDFDDEYLPGLVNQIKEDIPGLDDWTVKDMIGFLNVASYNGVEPRETAEQVLRLNGPAFWDQVTDYNAPLSIALSMGRGRRFMKTAEGRLGLAPFIGTRARTEEGAGSPIAVIHGCSVPIVLECVSEERGEYRIVGDCYLLGGMCGELVQWEEPDAKTFILV
jgi:hypothetical protein